MSKTSKIRKLRTQLSAAQENVKLLNWEKERLWRDLMSRQIPFEWVPPPVPEFRGNNWDEVAELNKLVNYIYRQWKVDVNREFKYNYGIRPDDMRFVLYLSTHIYMMLARVAGYHDFRNDGNKLTFHGHEVILVDRVDNHIKFVRVK